LGYDISHSTVISDYLGPGASGERELPADVILFKKGSAPKFTAESSSFNGDLRDEAMAETEADEEEEEEEEQSLPQLGDIIQTAQVQSFYEKETRGGQGDHHEEEEEPEPEQPAGEEEGEGGEEEALAAGQLQSETVL
jgi:hypothetical protein